MRVANVIDSQVSDAACARPPATRGELRHPLTMVHSGERDVTIAYELTGAESAPLVIIGGGISAGRHVISSNTFPEPGWWEAQTATLGSVRVLAIDWIGADGAIDEPIDPADQANALVALLDELGLTRADAFIGASYGAMVGQQVAARHPDRCGRLLSFSAGASAHPFSSACRLLQRKAVALGEQSGYSAAGVSLARALAMLTYRTADEYRARFDGAPVVEGTSVRVSAESYLDAQGARYAARTSPIAYRRLSESIDLHCVDPAMLRLPAMFVAVDSDWLVPIEDIRAFADAVPGSDFKLMPSLYGHDGFLKEVDQVAFIITRFLSSPEPIA